MRVAVFSCNGRERVYFSRANINNFKFRYFSKDLTINTIGLAEGFNTIIVTSPDCLTPLLLQQLHRLQIRYIIFYNKGKLPAPTQIAKKLNIRLACVADNNKINLPEGPSSYSLSKNNVNTTFTNEIGTLAMETIIDWKKGRKSRFELDDTMAVME